MTRLPQSKMLEDQKRLYEEANNEQESAKAHIEQPHGYKDAQLFVYCIIQILRTENGT